MVESADAHTLDWERCIICGEDGDLRCPADRPDGEDGALLSYDDFLQNVDGCLVAFRNRYRSLRRDSQKEPCNGEILQFRVFAELVSYIENKIEEGSYIFKLSEIHSLYDDRLSVLGLHTSVNKSRLKTQILLHFASDCQEQSDGRNTLLVFTEGLQRKLQSAVTARDFDGEAMSMSRVVNSVRCDMAAQDGFEFSGSFPTDCQERSVPVSLKSLVSMLLYGNDITDQNNGHSQACLTICQLILFNSKQPTPTSSKPRHTKKREPPLPVLVLVYWSQCAQPDS